jgi:hypothetical protein
MAGQLRLSGMVMDSLSGKPVEGCHVEVISAPCSDISDQAGRFEINCLTERTEYKITISGLNYRKKEISVQPTQGGKTEEITIYIAFESMLLPDISIDGKPAVVWKDNLLNVADIAFIGDQMLLLAYSSEERWKRQEESKTTLYRGCHLILLDENEQEVTRISIPEVAIGLYTKYPGEIFLIGRHKKYYISIEDRHLELLSLSDEDFSNGVKPIAAQNGEQLCVSNYEEDFPEFGYSILDRESSLYTPVRTIVHEHQMEMFRSEYKYLAPKDKLEAFRFEVNTGIDKEIVAGYMSGYANSIYYEPINAPLFDQDNQLHIFDHVHGMIYSHDWTGTPADSVLITYHHTRRPEKWSEQIYSDKITGRFYTTIVRSGRTFITEIDRTSGQCGPKQQLYYQYIDKVTVHRGRVYYIYRPFESSQNRYLYSEKLNG